MNLSVKISGPWEKSAPRKNCEILLWFETSKNNSCRCGRWVCKCPCLQKKKEKRKKTKEKEKKTTLWPLFMDVVQLPQG